MKYWFLLFTLFFSITELYSQIVFDSTSINLGEIPTNTRIKGKIYATNIGERHEQIVNARSSSGGVFCSMNKNVITLEPQERVHIAYSISPRLRSSINCTIAVTHTAQSSNSESVLRIPFKATVTEKAGPLIFDSLIINCGVLVYGESLKRTLSFKNNSDHPIEIIRAHSSGGHLVARANKDPISPGGYGKIFYNYDTKAVGKINKTIYVRYRTNGMEYTTQLYVRGEVIKREVDYKNYTDSMLKIYPTGLKFDKKKKRFGKVLEGDKAEWEIQYKNVTKDRIWIERFNQSGGIGVCNWPKEPIAPNQSGTIIYKYPTKGRVGNWSKALTIRTNNGIEHFNSYGTVVARVVAAVPKNNKVIKTAWPSGLQYDSTVYNVGNISGERHYDMEIRAKNITNAPLYIDRCRASLGCLSWSRDPILPGKEARFKYHYPAKGRYGRAYKTIYIRTNLGEQRLSFKAVVMKPQLIPKPSPNKLISNMKLEFDSTTYNVGRIAQNTELILEIPFTNLNRTPIEIEDCQTADGYTFYENKLINIGQQSKITYQWDPKNSSGYFSKLITVITSNGTDYLWVKGYIDSEKK